MISYLATMAMAFTASALQLYTYGQKGCNGPIISQGGSAAGIAFEECTCTPLTETYTGTAQSVEVNNPNIIYDCYVWDVDNPDSGCNGDSEYDWSFGSNNVCTPVPMGKTLGSILCGVPGCKPF